MSTVIGVDGGNTKTDVAVATLDGDVRAYVRGPGSNSHGLGSDGSVAVIASLVEYLAFERPAEHGAFFLCGADVPEDIAELSAAIDAQPWVRRATVDNDTFALLRAGTNTADAIAVVCGAGINCVGRSAAGRSARYPSLGWETGDWGGAEALGREALFLAARAEDGRGEPTALVELVRSHFGLSVLAVGEAVHYQRMRDVRLGELAPGVVATAAGGDAVARMLVERLADEIVLMVRRAIADLDVRAVDVVLGGGMLAGGEGLLHELVVARLPRGARAVTPGVPPVAGAVLAALDAAGAGPPARERVRAAFHDGLAPEDVRD